MNETPTRNSATHKQANTWLDPEQIETIRDACLSESFPTYLQDRNETIIVLLTDTGLRVSELVALNYNYGIKIFQVERIANAHADSLTEEDMVILDDLKASLSMFGPAREHIILSDRGFDSYSLERVRGFYQPFCPTV